MATDDHLLAKVPKYHELIYPTLKALRVLGGSGTNEEILDRFVSWNNFQPKLSKYHTTTIAKPRSTIGSLGRGHTSSVSVPLIIANTAFGPSPRREPLSRRTTVKKYPQKCEGW